MCGWLLDTHVECSNSASYLQDSLYACLITTQPLITRLNRRVEDGVQSRDFPNFIIWQIPLLCYLDEATSLCMRIAWALWSVS